MQSGSSTVQLLCYLVTGWVLLTAVLRLSPIYLEHRTIISVLETIVDQYDSSKDTTARIKKKINEAWSINAIDRVDPDSVRINRRRSELTLVLKYDARFPIAGDISGVWTFDETLTTP